MLKRLTTLTFILFSTLLLLPVELHSQTAPNRAALLVDFGNGQVHAQCISFDEEQISGQELLQRSGLPFEVDINGGLGAAVCKINDVGCPGTDCFCHCPGGSDCLYWSYWHLINDSWQYSVAGASSYTLHNGDVDGWVWGPGSANEASPPMSTSFEQICPAQAAPTHTPTPRPTFTATPSVTPLPATETPAPEISFTAEDYTIQSGGCTQLQWNVQHVTAVFLDNAGVSGQDTATVCPTQTQTYHLRITHPAGELTESVTIQVVDTPVPPTNTPFPPTNTPIVIAQAQAASATPDTPTPSPTETASPTAAPTNPPPTETATAAPTQEMIMIEVPPAPTATPLPTPVAVAAVSQTVDITPQAVTLPTQPTSPSIDWLGYTVFIVLSSFLAITLLIIRRQN